MSQGLVEIKIGYLKCKWEVQYQTLIPQFFAHFIAHTPSGLMFTGTDYVLKDRKDFLKFTKPRACRHHDSRLEY